MVGEEEEVAFLSTLTACFQEEAAKSVLAEFNLGCDVEHTQHVYRVYVTTFLGFGGNMARQRYEERLFNATLAANGWVHVRAPLAAPANANPSLLCLQSGGLADGPEPGHALPGPVSAGGAGVRRGEGQPHRAPAGAGRLEPLPAGRQALPGPPQRHHVAGRSLPGGRGSELPAG